MATMNVKIGRAAAIALALLLPAGCGLGLVAAGKAVSGGGGGGGGGSGNGGGTGGGGGGGGNELLVVTTSLGANATVQAGDVVEFTITASRAGATSLALVLLNPEPGCVFTRDSAGVGTVTGRVRWLVPPFAGGLHRLLFRASDRDDASATQIAAASVRIDGASNAVLVVNGDVTGDGLIDTVAVAPHADVNGTVDAGAIYVWIGGAAPSSAPDATLVVPGAVAGDLLGTASGQGIQLADVTGDGILDIVVGASSAGANDAGAIYVWQGGAALTGAQNPPPTAILSVAGAAAGDQLGNASGQGIQLADVTGDGILDVVAGAALADANGVADAGAIVVWMGGPSLVGTPAPVATLTASGAQAGDQLGNAGGQGVLLADVTGDGVLDVVAGATLADLSGVADVGSVTIWKGGAALTGSANPPPLASLVVAGASAGDLLGFAAGQGIELVDVTGDGIADVVAGAELADADGTIDAGAIYLWKGGAALESPAPALYARLAVAGARAGDRLGHASDQGIVAGDVTGDGLLDLVAGAQFADDGGVTDAGAIYLWPGGADLDAPVATTLSAGGVANDQLGNASGHALLLVDVTGDGIDDVVAGAELADAGATADVGALYVWRGGATLATAPALTTLTVAGGAAGDQLGNANGQGIQVADVTSDGVPDLVVGAQQVGGGEQSRGAIYVWSGGANLQSGDAPATLRVTSGEDGGRLGDASGQGVQVADVSGDGTLDVVACNRSAEAGADAAGTIYVWKGAGALGGSPDSTLRVANAANGDQLGNAAGQAVQFADLTGDGVLDVAAAAQLADRGGVANAGAIYVFAGGDALGARPDPIATLTAPAAVAGDQLGFAGGQGVRLADVNGDGLQDVLGVASLADLGGVVDAGAIYLWTGGLTDPGLSGPPARLANPSAAAGDQIGN